MPIHKRRRKQRRKKNIFISAIGITLIAIAIDFLGHLTLTEPMETAGYFIAKFIFFSISSFIFLRITKRINFQKILLGGIIIALGWGFYYNIIPSIYPNFQIVGIPLSQLSFLGQRGFLGGLYFGILHVLGFIVGASIINSMRK